MRIFAKFSRLKSLDILVRGRCNWDLVVSVSWMTISILLEYSMHLIIK